MAGTGLSAPIVARYTDDGFGNITYTQGRRFAKAIELSTEFNTDSKGNNLYADNAIAETQNVFSGGTINLTTDDLDFEASKLLLNVREEEVDFNGKKINTIVNRDGDSPPYVGFGVVEERQKDTKPYFIATFLPKVAFKIPSKSAKTKGESIEWQTPQISGTIMRDDTPDHKWKVEAKCATESEAIEFLKWKLGMLPLSLSVTSAEGTQSKKTAIVVSPVKQSGNTYKYFVGDEVYIPDKDALVPDNYSTWDGTEEIEAETGKKILIVEANAENKVQRAGSTQVIAKGETQ